MLPLPPFALSVSRSSLNRGFYHPEQPVREEDALVVRNREGALEQYGNTTTFNLENVLRQNILTSSYYKQSALPIDNWADLVDEIYYRYAVAGARVQTRCRGLWVSVGSSTFSCPRLLSWPVAAWTTWSPG